jgi:hypothetical protein
MRRYLLVVPFLFACAKGENATADSAAAAMAPAALTEADLAGTWTGTATMEGTDSVFAHWTQVCANGTCRGTTTESPKDTVVSSYVIAADSSAGTSVPLAQPGITGMVIDHWVVRVNGNQATGTGRFTLVDKPDSVVMRYRFSGTKAP